MSKKALGKGIEALLAGSGEDPGRVNAVISVSLDRILPNPDQPRKTISDTALAELADSIRENGIIQPVIVEAAGDGYRIIAGERRYRASILAGLHEIPVIVRETTDNDRFVIALIENIQREDLNPIEEAEAFARIMERTGANQDELAKRVGKNRSTVANSLRLLRLPPEMKDAVSQGSISAGHARAILALKDEGSRSRLFARIVRDGLSVRDAEAFSAGGPQSTAASKSGGAPVRKRPAELRTIEERLLDILGTKVQVVGSQDKGKIEIHYYSSGDLSRLYDLLIGD